VKAFWQCVLSSRQCGQMRLEEGRHGFAIGLVLALVLTHTDHSERQVVHHRRSQARDDRPLPRRVLVRLSLPSFYTSHRLVPSLSLSGGCPIMKSPPTKSLTSSITYKPVGHGRGANMKDSRFVPLK
jgi:hypothetical protein